MNSQTIQNSLSILKQLDRELEKSKSSIQSPTSSSQLSQSPTKLIRRKINANQKQSQQQSQAINIISEIDLLQNNQLRSTSQHSITSTQRISPLRKKLFNEDPFQQKCAYLERTMQQEDQCFSSDLEFLSKDLEQTRQRLQSILKIQPVFE